MLLYIPSVQNFLVQKVATYLSETTNAEVGIGSVSLRFPLDLSIEEAKFRGMVQPGDTLEMPIEILRLGRISKIYAEAYVNGKLCAQATLNFILGATSHV